MDSRSSILLIEDDEGDALLVREELADVPQAPAIEWVRSLADAVGPLSRGVRCVLLDLGLPDADGGLSTLRAVRELAPEAAVLVLTGQDDEHLGIRALGEGAQDYLVKGAVDGRLLTRAIRYAIERRRADQAALQLREAQLQARENARLERGLLPSPLISDPRLSVLTGYRPGRRSAVLGGDFFDAVELPGGVVRAVIGDVSGHSVDEAALGACLRIAWRTLTLAGSEPAQLLGTLEQMLLHERHDDDVFATLCMLEIAADRRRVRMYLAGHPLPILVDEQGVRLIAGATHPPVGLSLDPEWPSVTIEPQGEWSMLLYTDGLVEGRVGRGSERLGAERLVELVREHVRHHAQPLIDTLIERVAALCAGELTDDIAALWLTSSA
ncbi:MAG TPA: fused response regulator/phosphatase [Solirubrobacteraceae bacterium]|nr:fused response regulator/phosphatase [Solirubrobacteraceae bacterium]